MADFLTWRGLTLTRRDDAVYRTPPDCSTPCRVYEGEDDDDGTPRWWASAMHGAMVLEVSGPTPESALDAAVVAGREYASEQVRRWTDRLAKLRALERKQ